MPKSAKDKDTELLHKQVDPCEFLIRNALAIAGYDFQENVKVDDRQIDFYIPDLDLYIEVKQYHSDRISSQMSKVQNIIAVQGLAACQQFAEILKKGRPDD